ncbi:MAG: hypothetical protein LBH72_01085 [Proteiniphilum sp.]|jgi:hypothetical protein|nr:hypothetical protein [Proteiniphilum sp.]
MVMLSTGGVSEKERFANIRSRAAELGVLDINFSGENPADSLECYEKALEIITKNKDLFDINAGEKLA